MPKKLPFISVSLIVTEIIAEIIFRYPCNHGNNFHVQACVLVFFLLTAAINFKKNKGTVCLSAIGLLFILLINYYNVGIDYETWIERSMPEWGEEKVAVPQTP